MYRSSQHPRWNWSYWTLQRHCLCNLIGGTKSPQTRKIPRLSIQDFCRSKQNIFHVRLRVFLAGNYLIPMKEMNFDPLIFVFVDLTGCPTIFVYCEPFTEAPTQSPSISPTLMPTEMPSTRPTQSPSYMPSYAPTLVPSISPTTRPTLNPTIPPSMRPTLHPSLDPTRDPTRDPTYTPSVSPTRLPSQVPTIAPTDAPTPEYMETKSPTYMPTTEPTLKCDRCPEGYCDQRHCTEPCCDGNLMQIE